MGSKGGSAASSQPASVVCCMCGDHGLTQELFPCKVCLIRSQHKYCSDLYPRAELYKVCNWCLKEGSKDYTISSNIPSSSSSSSNNNQSSNNGGSGGVKLHRGAFSSLLSKPIKKLRLLERSASDVTGDRLRSEENRLSPGSRKGRQTFRGKARRYKLLEEVSS